MSFLSHLSQILSFLPLVSRMYLITLCSSHTDSLQSRQWCLRRVKVNFLEQMEQVLFSLKSSSVPIIEPSLENEDVELLKLPKLPADETESFDVL